MARLSSMQRLRRLPLWKLRLLLEASACLLLARCALLLVPFPLIGKHLGTLQMPSLDSPCDDRILTDTVRQIGRIVDTAANYLPLPLVCLPRALAGWQMLHRRGITSRLHFGAMKVPDPNGPKGLQTHAWLSSRGVEVLGYPIAHDCVELGYYARERVTQARSASTQSTNAEVLR